MKYSATLCSVGQVSKHKLVYHYTVWLQIKELYLYLKKTNEYKINDKTKIALHKYIVNGTFQNRKIGEEYGFRLILVEISGKTMW